MFSSMDVGLRYSKGIGFAAGVLKNSFSINNLQRHGAKQPVAVFVLALAFDTLPSTLYVPLTYSEYPALSLSQAQRIKKLSQVRQLTEDTMLAIMSEEKKSDLDKVTFTTDTLRKYFPKSYTPKKMQDTIIKLLEQWQRKRQQEQSR